MIYKKLIIVVIVIFLTGCATDNEGLWDKVKNQYDISKEDIGKIAGGIIGGILGNQVGHGNGKTIATVLGAAGGVWIGGRIGRDLDAKDKVNLKLSTYETARTGKTRNWKNSDSGVSIKTEKVSTQVKNDSTKISYMKDRIKTVPPLELIGEAYQVRSRSNVRGGPGTDYKIVSKLEENTAVNVIGKVEGKSWYMIGNEGVAQGFVSSALLSPSEVLIVADTKYNAPAKSTVEIAKVETKKKCHTIKQTIVLKDGTRKVENITVCQGVDGLVAS